jgi:hypothetical protein
MILIPFFCRNNILLLSEKSPQNIMIYIPYIMVQWIVQCVNSSLLTKYTRDFIIKHTVLHSGKMKSMSFLP